MSWILKYFVIIKKKLLRVELESKSDGKTGEETEYDKPPARPFSILLCRERNKTALLYL